jgi:hypothetical protein
MPVHLFFLSTLLGGVVAGHSHCLVWLVALDHLYGFS